MLLGDADRELLYETLKRHAAEGRLDVAELERRVVLVAEQHGRLRDAIDLDGRSVRDDLGELLSDLR